MFYLSNFSYALTSTIRVWKTPSAKRRKQGQNGLEIKSDKKTRNHRETGESADISGKKGNKLKY